MGHQVYVRVPGLAVFGLGQVLLLGSRELL